MFWVGLVAFPLPLWEREQSCLNIVKATNAGEGRVNNIRLFLPLAPWGRADFRQDFKTLPSPLGERVRVRGVMGEGRNFYPCHCEKIFDFRGSPFFYFNLSGDIGSRLSLAP